MAAVLSLSSGPLMPVKWEGPRPILTDTFNAKLWNRGSLAYLLRIGQMHTMQDPPKASSEGSFLVHVANSFIGDIFSYWHQQR